MVGMSREQRIAVEALAPPLLGAVIFQVTGCGSDSVAARLLYFIPFVAVVYAVAIVPSFFYMLLMEAWIALRLRTRLGLIPTAGFSALLGCAAGFLLECFMDGGILSFAPLWIGGFVGFVIALYVGRKRISPEGVGS